MVTYRGMISGFDPVSNLLAVQAPINKGNSGGALLNRDGHVVGIVSYRLGGISMGLNQLRAYIDRMAANGQGGGVVLDGVDPLAAMREIISTLDQHISTGIGYARTMNLLKQYVEENPDVLK